MLKLIEPVLGIDYLRDVANKMMIAARTAPKGRGNDNTVMAVAEGETVKKIAEKLKEMGEKYDHKGFLRDAANILAAPLMLIFGTKIAPANLKVCGMCGFKDCAEKNSHPAVPCVFNTGDLGIAIGSAVSVAMDHRVDNRIMYTVGRAVVEMGILGAGVNVVYAIPLSATSKNPFFDRA